MQQQDLYKIKTSLVCELAHWLFESLMRILYLKFGSISYGLIAFIIAFILVMWFDIKTTNNYGQMWVLVKKKFEMRIKIFNATLNLF